RRYALICYGDPGDTVRIIDTFWRPCRTAAGDALTHCLVCDVDRLRKVVGSIIRRLVAITILKDQGRHASLCLRSTVRTNEDVLALYPRPRANKRDVPLYSGSPITYHLHRHGMVLCGSVRLDHSLIVRKPRDAGTPTPAERQP